MKKGRGSFKHRHVDSPFEPSWTGQHAPQESTGSKRLRHWLRSADTKHGVEEGSFTDNINWRIFRIIAEFVEGFEFLSGLKKEVSVFGSTRTSSGNAYYEIAREIGRLCAENGFSIVTGGGPGMMEAANRGSMEAGGESVGLDISLPHEQRRNPFVKKGIGFHYFFTRKTMLSAAAQAYVFMPGGFGTLDELFEIVCLIQTGKMSDMVPVILVGRAFWHPMLQWLERMVYEEYKFVDHEDLKIMHVVDTAEEAMGIIKKTHKRML